MGFFSTSDKPVFRSNVATMPPIQRQDEFADVMGAAFRQNNIVYGLYQGVVNSGDSMPNPNHNPLDTIRGTKYEQNMRPFIGSRSVGEDRAIMRKMDQEEKDNQILGAAGWGGVLASMVAGTLDPTIALPGSIAIKAGKAGYEFTRAAINVGAAGALQAGSQEAILQATQVNRPLSESLMNVASGTVLAGLIGGAASRFISASERRVLEQSLDRARADMDAHANPQPAPVISPKPDAIGAPPLIPEAVPAAPLAEPAPLGLAASVGAAATDTRALEMQSSIPGTKRISPTRFVLEAESPAARRVMADTAETPYSYKGSLEGEAAYQMTPADRIVKIQKDGLQNAVNTEIEQLFINYRFGQAAPSLARMRAGIDDLLGRSEGKMSYHEWKKQVSEAVMFGPNAQGIPEVNQAAQIVQQKVFEPWAARAEAAIPGFKRLVSAEGENFFPHNWNKEKIRQHKPEFTDQLVEKYRADQGVKAAIKQRLEFANAQLNSWEGDIARIEGRLQRLDVSRGKLAARFDERAQEVGRAESRTGVLEERATSIGEELSEIGEFIAEMRKQTKDPAMLARLDSMEEDAARLRRADRPMTEAQLRAVEEEELGGILTGTTRMAAEMLSGRRSFPKTPSFISWLVANGGIKDVGGDLASVLGGKKVRPGLINARGREFDALGQKLQEEFPGAFPHRDVPGGGAPERDEILGWIDAETRGSPPAWWIEHLPMETSAKVEAGRMAATLDEAFHRAGIEVKSAKDVAKVLRDESSAPMTLRDLDAVVWEMEQVGQDIPVSVRRAGAEEQLAIGRADLQALRDVIDKAKGAKASKERRLSLAEARGEEAALAERANKGRLGVLDERMDFADRRRELMVDMLETAGRQRDEIRAKIETEIAAWEGKSSKEAKAALKAREKYELDTARPDEAPRLTGADSTIDRAVKRIIASERDLTDQDLRSVAQQTVNRILGSPDGRLPYDVFSNDPFGAAGAGGSEARGSLATRRLHVDNKWAQPWIEDDIEHVMASYLRTVVPDVVLAERFGDPEMSQAIRAIQEDYSRLSDAARGDPARQKKLDSEMNAVIQQVAGVRDRIRGVYGWDPSTANLGRVTASLKQINNLTSMGMSAIASITDFAGAPIRYGLMNTFNDAWVPFFNSMITKNEGLEAQKRYIRSLGLGVDTRLNLRQHALDDIIDGYRPPSRVEKALQWTGDKFFVANLLSPLTDLQKQLAGSVVIPEMIRAAKAITEGKATKGQIRDMADAGIDANMAGRIHRQMYELGHSTKVDGVMLPNTADWTDKAAAMSFDGAVARAIDINVVTPGQEKPLFMSKPVGGLLFQFKSFPAAATERILISNLQRRDAKALSGVITSVALGMLSYKINSMLGGQPVSDDPRQWIKEGINRSGITGWMEEGNSMAAKLTRGTLDVHRLYGADKPLSRYASRSLADAFLGPTAGKLQSIGSVGGAAATGEWTESDTKALRRLIFFQNMFWLRNAFNGVESGANQFFNIPEKAKN